MGPSGPFATAAASYQNAAMPGASPELEEARFGGALGEEIPTALLGGGYPNILFWIRSQGWSISLLGAG